jgi:hypothetical protein
MERIERYFDKKFGRITLNLANFWAVLGGLYLGTAICMIIKYTRSGDQIGAGLGYCNAFASASQVFMGTQAVRAVVRRLIAQSRDTQ